MPARSTVTSRPGKAAGQIEKAVAALARRRLLVGVPGDAAPRPREPGQKSAPPSNALVGYVMEFGDDEHRIPPRPFLLPGVRDAKAQIVKGMQASVKAAFSGNLAGIEAGFAQAGLAAVVSVRAKINSGPFAPLAISTIEARARRRNKDTGRLSRAASSKNAREFLKRRAAGTPEAVLHDAGLAKPLRDTGSLYTAVQYVVRVK